MVLAFHIVAMVAWFAGLFYLPRLFVYHAEARDEISDLRFRVMERRLYRGIMMPAVILTAFFGVLYGWGRWSLYYLHQPWMILKLSLVLLLGGYHYYCGHLLKQFARGQNVYSAKFYRFFNEIPTLILIAVVCLVVVKPHF